MMFKHLCYMFLFVSIYGEIIKVQKKHLNKIYPDDVVHEISLPTWTLCVEHCSRMPVCKSVNFIACQRLCQIRDHAEGNSKNLKNSANDMCVPTTSSSMNLAGSCRNNDCKKNQLCIENGSSYTCITQVFMKCNAYGVVFRGHCYYVAKLNLTWEEAQTHCEQHLGANLVKIDDECENTWLTNLLVDHDVKVATSFWIGLNDREQEDTWVWISDKSSMTYADWSPDNPNNGLDIEHCVMMAVGLYKQWHDVPCDFRRPFVCEAPALRT